MNGPKYVLLTVSMLEGILARANKNLPLSKHDGPHVNVKC